MRNKLNEEQKKDALNKLPGWSLVLNKESITKSYIFKEFSFLKNIVFFCFGPEN